MMQANRRVYVAGPINTGGNVSANVRAGVDAAERLLNAHLFPYCPHLTHFWDILYPHDRSVWLALDHEWLITCDALVRLPGDSLGADQEVVWAIEVGIRVLNSTDECIEWFNTLPVTPRGEAE